MSGARRLLIRVLVVLTLVCGSNYLVWRWLESINWANWWIAVPLVLAETYSLVDAFLFGATMWRLKVRGEPPAPPEGATADVFVTTYNEPLDLVMTTARAAKAIRHPHRTWILDDGARDELRQMAEAEGIGWITRSADWHNRPRHAKAGNLNNALFQTDGEFLLILDADQIPDPAILDRTLGYFRDPLVALVQTPQYFTNVDESDPLGSQAPLFYGPIQQGKDGWNAAFFCGSNAVLRREALMQLGIVGYVREVERAVRQALRTAEDVIAKARKEAREHGPAVSAALDTVADAVRRARADLQAGEPVSEVTHAFQRRVDDAARGLVAADLEALRADLAAIEGLPVEVDRELGGVVVDEVALQRLAQRDWSPLGAMESVRALVTAVDVGLDAEAQPLMPLATISVTEDMATAMRLHSTGWRTVYHHEILAYGLAPEDIGTMLHQRLRWAQGTLQVMLKENPLLVRGLSTGQRLMYFATMWSYLSGFAAVAYIAAPILYLFFGIRPVETLDDTFLVRIIPYLLFTQLLFFVVGYGIRTWRGQQYSLALFPLWIRACTTAVGNVHLGRSLGFVVTPKTRQENTRTPWHLIRPQLIAIGLLAAAAVVGLVRLALGQAPTVQGTWINIVWVAYDLVVLSVIVQAARYRGPVPADQERAKRKALDLVVRDDHGRRYVSSMASVAAVVLTGVLAAGATLLLTDSLRLGGPSAARAASAAREASPSAPADVASPTPAAPTPAAPSPTDASPTQTSPTQAASATCDSALVQADAVAQRSTALEQALAEHTRIMEELLAQRLTADQALDETLPVLTRGATERDRLKDELAAYETSRGACAG